MLVSYVTLEALGPIDFSNKFEALASRVPKVARSQMPGSFVSEIRSQGFHLVL